MDTAADRHHIAGHFAVDRGRAADDDHITLDGLVFVDGHRIRQSGCGRARGVRGAARQALRRRRWDNRGFGKRRRGLGSRGADRIEERALERGVEIGELKDEVGIHAQLVAQFGAGDRPAIDGDGAAGDLDRADARHRGFRPERDAAAYRQHVIEPFDLGAHRFRTCRPASAPTAALQTPIRRPLPPSARAQTSSPRARQVYVMASSSRRLLFLRIKQTLQPEQRTGADEEQQAGGAKRTGCDERACDGPSDRGDDGPGIGAAADGGGEPQTAIQRELEQTDQTRGPSRAPGRTRRQRS